MCVYMYIMYLEYNSVDSRHCVCHTHSIVNVVLYSIVYSKVPVCSVHSIILLVWTKWNLVNSVVKKYRSSTTNHYLLVTIHTELIQVLYMYTKDMCHDAYMYFPWREDVNYFQMRYFTKISHLISFVWSQDQLLTLLFLFSSFVFISHLTNFLSYGVKCSCLFLCHFAFEKEPARFET